MVLLTYSYAPITEMLLLLFASWLIDSTDGKMLPLRRLRYELSPLKLTNRPDQMEPTKKEVEF